MSTTMTTSTPVQSTTQPDHVKVRLTYETHKATTEAALMLSDQLGLPGPYGEEVCILVRRAQVFSGLHTYTPYLTLLKECGVIPADAQLKSFRIELDDRTTLAYVME